MSKAGSKTDKERKAMTVTVRFAPSPTGRLHVGNVRTALINWMFAKANGGQFILRIDDTDTERSTAENEAQIKEDLTWLGMVWDRTFNQSDRFDKYDAAADKLRGMGLLYPCYETAEELDLKRKILLKSGRPPIYDRAALDLSEDDKAKYEAEGRKPHWRFKLSGNRVEWTDHVRGEQGIETTSLSDPILIRGDGSYLYTLPSVVDDIEAGITHVVRGEDHVTNSGGQIEIFEALGGKAPEMAHTALLLAADGGKLGKRLGSLSMVDLREQGFEPMAICSLLGRIGTSENVEVFQDIESLSKGFSFDKLGRSPARFDENDLKGLNASILHEMSFDDARPRLEAVEPRALDNPLFWETVRANSQLISDVKDWADIVYGEVEPQIDDEDRDFIARAGELFPEGNVNEESWGALTSALKADTGRKGKGLFMPLRRALTGRKFGPDMSVMLQLMGRDRALSRLQNS